MLEPTFSCTQNFSKVLLLTCALDTLIVHTTRCTPVVDAQSIWQERTRGVVLSVWEVTDVTTVSICWQYASWDRSRVTLTFETFQNTVTVFIFTTIPSALIADIFIVATRIVARSEMDRQFGLAQTRFNLSETKTTSIDALRVGVARRQRRL